MFHGSYHRGEPIQLVVFWFMAGKKTWNLVKKHCWYYVFFTTKFWFRWMDIAQTPTAAKGPVGPKDSFRSGRAEQAIAKRLLQRGKRNRFVNELRTARPRPGSYGPPFGYRAHGGTCNHLFLPFFPKLKLLSLYLMNRYLALDHSVGWIDFKNNSYEPTWRNAHRACYFLWERFWNHPRLSRHCFSMVVFFCEEKIRSRTCHSGFAMHAGWLVACICLGNETSHQRTMGKKEATTNRCGGKFEEVESVYLLKKMIVLRNWQLANGNWQLNA